MAAPAHLAEGAGAGGAQTGDLDALADGGTLERLAAAGGGNGKGFDALESRSAALTEKLLQLEDEDALEDPDSK